MTPVHYHTGAFPPSDIDWERLLPLIGRAGIAIGRYEGGLDGIPNSDVLISPLINQEAVLSSRIEGTQATLSEVLEFEAEGKPNDESTPKKADIQEVLNYRLALDKAIESMEELPLSQRLIRETHEVLMCGVRGRNKDPGNYRRISNWIGPEGCPQEQARFIPCGAEHLEAAMGAWEAYIHEDAPDALVQLAIAHAEFEAIHPFLDGNGRIGRLIVPLFLVEKGLLAKPNFYISEYLERHRDAYYDRLLAVSRDGDWTGWCAFFLEALISQAEMNRTRAHEILSLYDEKKGWIAEHIPSQYAVSALDWIFKNPIFRTSYFVATSGIPEPTARRILREARKRGLLAEFRSASGRRPAILAFFELLNIAEGKDIF